MSWDRTGQTIRGKYFGQFPIEGTVIGSWVVFGACIKHMIQLTESVVLGDLGYFDGNLLIDEKDIETVVDTKA